MKRITVSSLVLLLILSGCIVPSLYPLFEKNDFVLENRILGTWKDTEGQTWKFESVPEEEESEEPEKMYLLTHTDEKGLEAHLSAAFGKIGTHLFMDTYAMDTIAQNAYTYQHMIPAHLFAKIVIEGEKVYVFKLDGEWFDTMAEKKKLKVDHLIDASERLILTTSTKELQRFLRKHADNPDLYQDPITLTKE